MIFFHLTLWKEHILWPKISSKRSLIKKKRAWTSSFQMLLLQVILVLSINCPSMQEILYLSYTKDKQLVWSFNKHLTRLTFTIRQEIKTQTQQMQKENKNLIKTSSFTRNVTKLRLLRTQFYQRSKTTCLHLSATGCQLRLLKSWEKTYLNQSQLKTRSFRLY